jgi:Fe-S-cluster-containing dehydrogenase component
MSRDLNRRDFIILGALSGMTACTRQPEETILPYAASPEATVPGQPLYFATALPLAGFGLGVLVKSIAGRPIKIEGNPEHPASLGATDAFAQAWLWSLYDPARAQWITQGGRPRVWADFTESLEQALKHQRSRQGQGLRILTQTVTSPTLAWQLSQLEDAFPAARWHQFEPFTRDPVREAARLAFDRDLHVRYRFDRAEVVVSLDADFLTNVRCARDFMRKRPRLYVFETMPSATGAKADRRVRLSPRELETFAFDLASGSTVTRELEQHRGASVVLAGNEQPVRVHLLSYALNHRLGNLGKTVELTEPVEALPTLQLDSLKELVRDMAAGRVEVLLMLGGNPVRDAPADLAFEKHLANVALRIHASLYANETSRLCHWHIPEAHPLEAWSDIRAFDGTATIMQPLIAPLYDGKSCHEVLGAFGGRPDESGYDLLREQWRGRAYSLFLRAGRSLVSEEDFDAFWRQSLHDGFVRDTAAEPVSATLRPDLQKNLPPPPASPRQGLEILFRPDPTIWDGRFAENAWLQELPKPITKLTWENAACLSPATAAALGVSSGDVVVLRVDGLAAEAPVWIVPGHADGAVTVTLEHGRAIRSSNALFFAGLEVKKTGRKRQLASTQDHHRMEGRPLLTGSGQFAPPAPSDNHAWGMAIDLDACTGCNACIIACVAENNIPTVGRLEVQRGREMHWLRIDQYVEGPPDEPRYVHQPVMCMHCENAPCELVCPTGATVHSADGLNEMVYNRCVGSRYCANNCPYKVRRFNFFQYAGPPAPVRRMLYNPDVTVRTRGVIEKCTYCVQRIGAARIAAAKENRRIRDGEVVTACQGVCPTQAIIFGDLSDPDSRVARVLATRPSFGLLAELNTKPRTRYLARESRNG